MLKSLTLFSPAKINVFFRVLNRREDGYHNIASVVQCVDFGDTLTFRVVSGEDEWSSSHEDLKWNSHNLIYRAAKLFAEKTDKKFSLSVHLEKRVPMQAGLGGGSSNAATTLYALNQLLHTELSDAQLAEWGSKLGADVPCFFSLGRVFCEGIGERLTPLPAEEASYWIAKPHAFSLATPEVYAGCRPYFSSVSPQHPLVNDLEEVALQKLPILKAFKQRCLDLGFHTVVMTGSGTAFVCYGEVSDPQLPDTLFVPVKALKRLENSWYQPS